MRVDTMFLSRTIQKCLALLPVVTHLTPVFPGLFHQAFITGFLLYSLFDTLNIVQQQKTGIAHSTIGRNDRVIHIRRHHFLQSGLLV